MGKKTKHLQNISGGSHSWLQPPFSPPFCEKMLQTKKRRVSEQMEKTPKQEQNLSGGSHSWPQAPTFETEKPCSPTSVQKNTNSENCKRGQKRNRADLENFQKAVDALILNLDEREIVETYDRVFT